MESVKSLSVPSWVKEANQYSSETRNLCRACDLSVGAAHPPRPVPGSGPFGRSQQVHAGPTALFLAWVPRAWDAELGTLSQCFLLPVRPGLGEALFTRELAGTCEVGALLLTERPIWVPLPPQQRLAHHTASRTRLSSPLLIGGRVSASTCKLYIANYVHLWYSWWRQIWKEKHLINWL